MTIRAAIAAAGRGWAVFPCRPGDKRPAVQDWEHKACADPGRVGRYWPSDRHNIGIACGPSRLVVLDLDAHGELPDEWQLPGINDGRDVFAQVCEWAGMDWPWTYAVATPSGGWHLYYTAPDGSTLRNKASDTMIGPMVDVRAAGGYVVGAGSVTPAGAYQVMVDEPPGSLPPWMERLFAPAARPERQRRTSPDTAGGPGRAAGLVRTVEQAMPGNRNHALFWAACTMARESPGDLGQLADAAGAAGLSPREITATIRSAQRTVNR